MRFATVQRSVQVSGIGLHCGLPVQVTLQPRPQNGPGLHFVRTDLPGQPSIPADVARVTTTTHATTLAEGAASISTTEHLLAALWALGITHCTIEVNGPEIPILDGSALPWTEALRHAGRRELAGERPTLALQRPVWLECGSGAVVLGLPHPGFRLTAAVDYGVEHARAQVFDCVVDEATFCSEIAPARTFTRESWLPALRQAGLIKGGSEENAIVLWENGPAPELRLPLELARHKVLDAIGDLALLLAPQGALFACHLIVTRAGHGPHRLWIEECLRAEALGPPN